MAHGENFKRDNPIAFAAWEMAQVFENNSDGQRGITPEGYMVLVGIFDRVPDQDKGDVFVTFLSQLDSRGIDYDINDFMTEQVAN